MSTESPDGALARLDAADCSFPCQPRETVSLFATVVGNDLPGVVELGDQTFTDVGGLVSLSSMSLTITGQGHRSLDGESLNQDQKLSSEARRSVRTLRRYPLRARHRKSGRQGQSDRNVD